MLRKAACYTKGIYSTAVLESCIQDGESVNGPDSYTLRRPLDYAAQCGNLDAIKHLIKLGAELRCDEKNPATTNLLYWIVSCKDINKRQELLIWLLENESYKKIDCDVTEEHILAALGDMHFESMLARKDDLAADKTGLTPLHYFIVSGLDLRSIPIPIEQLADIDLNYAGPKNFTIANLLALLNIALLQELYDKNINPIIDLDAPIHHKLICSGDFPNPNASLKIYLSHTKRYELLELISKRMNINTISFSTLDNAALQNNNLHKFSDKIRQDQQPEIFDRDFCHAACDVDSNKVKSRISLKDPNKISADDNCDLTLLVNRITGGHQGIAFNLHEKIPLISHDITFLAYIIKSGLTPYLLGWLKDNPNFSVNLNSMIDNMTVLSYLVANKELVLLEILVERDMQEKTDNNNPKRYIVNYSDPKDKSLHSHSLARVFIEANRIDLLKKFGGIDQNFLKLNESAEDNISNAAKLATSQDGCELLAAMINANPKLMNIIDFNEEVAKGVSIAWLLTINGAYDLLEKLIDARINDQNGNAIINLIAYPSKEAKGYELNYQFKLSIRSRLEIAKKTDLIEKIEKYNFIVMNKHKKQDQTPPVISTIIDRQEKLDALFKNSSIIPKVSQEKNVFSISFTSKQKDPNDIKELIKIIAPTKQSGLTAKNDNNKIYTISGKESAIKQFPSGIVANKLEQKFTPPGPKADTPPIQSAVQKQSNDNCNNQWTDHNYIERWNKALHSIFLKADEVTVVAQPNELCFTIQLPQNNTSWTIVPPGGKNTNYESCNINDIQIHDQIIKRLEKRFNKNGKSGARVEQLFSQRQIKVFPGTEDALAIIGLDGKIYDKIKPFTTSSNNNNNNKGIKKDDSNKNDNGNKKGSNNKSNKSNNNNCNTNKTKSNAKDLLNHILSSTIGQPQNKNFSLPLQEIEKITNTKYEVTFYYPVTTSLSLTPLCPVDSRLVLSQLQELFDAKANGFMKVYNLDADRIKIIIDLKPQYLNQILEELHSIRQSLNERLSNFRKSSENYLLESTNYTELQKDDSEINNNNNNNDPVPLASAVKTDRLKETHDMIKKIKGNKKTNFILHLEKLSEIHTKLVALKKSNNNNQANCNTNNISIEEKAYYYQYLLHALRILQILGSKSSDNENIYYHWRNVIRHAYASLNWNDFYQKICPLISTLIAIYSISEIEMNNLTFFSPGSKANNNNSLDKLAEALARFEKEIKDHDLGKDIDKNHTKGDYLTHIDAINDAQLPVDVKKGALIMLYALIGEPKNAKNPYKQIYGYLHSNLSTPFNDLTEGLYDLISKHLSPIHNLQHRR